MIGPDQRTQALHRSRLTGPATDPAATQLEESDMTFVFRLNGDLDPAALAAVSS